MNTNPKDPISSFNIKKVILLLIYYAFVFLITVQSFKKYPSNGAPSEAFVIYLAAFLISIILLIVSFVKMIKGNITAIAFTIIHVLAVIGLIYLVQNV